MADYLEKVKEGFRRCLTHINDAEEGWRDLAEGDDDFGRVILMEEAFEDLREAIMLYARTRYGLELRPRKEKGKGRGR